jgi:hypothetical protein
MPAWSRRSGQTVATGIAAGLCLRCVKDNEGLLAINRWYNLVTGEFTHLPLDTRKIL